MVKSRKAATNKKTGDATNTEVEATESSTEVIADENDKASQENGVDEVSSKKKGKGKAKDKKESTEEETTNDEETEEVVENGEDKKKPAPKSAKKTPKKETKPTSEPARKSSRTPKPVPKEGDAEEDYEVEKIVGFRIVRGKPQYQVRWKGYSKSEDTWEDEKALNCPELLQKFKADNAGADKKAKKRTASKSPSKSSSGKKTKKEEKDYEVEEIVGMRIKSGKKEFKIRWKGYKPSDDSWEPEKHLSCQDLIDEYLENHKDEVEEEEKSEPAKKPEKKTKSSGKSAKGKRTKTK